jgi:hypothetical protein
LPLRIHKTSEMSGGVRHRLEVESDRVSDSRHRTDVSQTDLVEAKKARPGPRDVQFVDEVLVGSGGGVVGPHVYRGDPRCPVGAEIDLVDGVLSGQGPR